MKCVPSSSRSEYKRDVTFDGDCSSVMMFQEVRKVNQMDQQRGLTVPTNGGTGIVILTGTAKKKVTEQKNKGNIHTPY